MSEIDWTNDEAVVRAASEMEFTAEEREEACQYVFTRFEGQRRLDAAITLQCELNRFQEAGRWIRVEERLPEPWQMVLAIGSSFDTPRIVYRPRLDDEQVKWFRDVNGQREYITHWQPLPAPPSSQDYK